MFLRSFTQMSRKCAISAEIEPKRIRSPTCRGTFENFRIVIDGPTRESGGMIAFTREPSLSLASTIGELSSMRLPSGETMRSIAAITWLLSANAMSVRWSLPLYST